MPTLTIDLREQKKWLDAFRAFVPDQFPEWQVEGRLVEIGDYSVGSALGIEHKSPSDFLSSLGSGRLFAQAQELGGAFERAYIVVDGDPGDVIFGSGRFSQVPPRSARGAIASLACHFGVPVLFCGSGEASFLWFVMQLAEKSQGDSSYYYSPLRRKASSDEHGAHLLGGLPGIGRKRAQAILAMYGSPLKALNHYAAWGNVDGIGKGTVEKVKNVLEPPTPPHGTPPPEAPQ